MWEKQGREGGGRKTENNCTKISGNVDKMSHCGGEEEEEEEKVFSRDLKIMSRDQEDKCVRARSLGHARSGPHEQQLDTRCHRVVKLRH